MSRLIEWLDHRMEVMGIENWKDLAESSGVSETALRDVNIIGSLVPLSRSEQRWLAMVLRVSLRKLEQLDRGEREWIPDDHVVDVDVRGRPLPWEDDPAYWMPKEVTPEDRGTPLVGRIRSNGVAEPDEDWQEAWGRRLPARFGKGYDIYAMEIEGVEQCVVFRDIPAWEFREGEAALYSWNGSEAKGWYGQVMLLGLTAVVVTIDGTRHRLDPETIVRIGKVIGRWQQPLRS
jgi:hypothetical protein